MCIRDRLSALVASLLPADLLVILTTVEGLVENYGTPDAKVCLLYTSDAADERSSVDLGGRRIIKKKKNDNDIDRLILIEDSKNTQTL